MEKEKSVEKGVVNVLRILPDLLKMEDTWNVLMAVMRQWGVENIIPTLLKTVRNVGLANAVRDLLSFNLGARIVPNLFLSLWDVLGDREALVSGDKRFTFKEMRERVLRLANGLQDLGLKPKDRIAVMLYNGNEFEEISWASNLCGFTLPLTNWHVKGEELLTVLKRQNPDVIIFDEEFMERIVGVKDQLKRVKNYIVVGERAPEEMILYEDLISKSSDKVPQKMEFLISFNPYTGGTTGVPKSMNYFDSWSYALSNVAEAPTNLSFKQSLMYYVNELSIVPRYGALKMRDKVSKNIRTLITTPMYHAATYVGRIPHVLCAATEVTMRKFDAEEFLRIIEKERINWAFLAPTILQRVLALPDEVKRKYDLISMYSIICATAPCPVNVKKEINELFRQQGAKGPVFNEYYGSSETAIITVITADDYVEKPKRIESVGRPVCGKLEIFDDEKGEWCPPNKDGRILSITNSTGSLRYYGTPEKIESAFKVVDGEEWFDDGLFGYKDEDDFVYLTTREKEIIIVGGVNIFPNEIEAAIIKNPKVFDVGVIRVPDKDLGEVPAAVVQLKEGKKSSKEEIIDWCKTEELYGYKIPRIVEFVKELPRHIDGKLMKRELEERYWKGMERRG